MADNQRPKQGDPAGARDHGTVPLAQRKDSAGDLAGADGQYGPLQTDSSGNLRVNVAAGGAGDGSILDGANSAIKATVLDLTNSNPLTVAITDSNGDQISSFGGGTQYTEDAAAAANPVGTVLNLIRTDTPAGRTTTDGDNVAACGTDKGELYVKHNDSVAVTNAGLTELAAAIDTEVQCDIVGALPAGTNNIGDVDVVSSALPTGASTLAEQQSQTTHLSTIAGDTTSIQTAVELIDDTVATDGAATPTKGILIAGQDGTNAQTIKTDTDGNLQIDVLTMPSTTVTATDLDIRDLTATDVVTANLSATDNAVLDSIDTSTQGILADTANIETSVQLIDDTVKVLGTDTYLEATTKGLVVGAVRRDADTTLVDTTNEIAPLQVDANGRLKVEAFSGEALPVTDNGGALTVDNAGTFATQSTLQTGDNTVGRVKLTDGTDVADVLDLTNSNPLTVAIVDGSGDQITSFGGGTQYTEDAAAAANPVGTVPILVRTDTPATQTTTDGDNVAQRGTNYGAAYVQVVTSAGAYVDTFGGGTQYTEGDTDATITGTAMMMEGAGNALVAAPGTAADGLLVNLGANNDVTITGTVTVTATNLDVQSGGADLATSTQAGAIQTAVELIDDTVKVLGTDTYTEATSKGVVMGAVRRDADTTLANTTNEFAPLQVDANGYLKVEIFDGGGSHTVDNGGTFAVQESGAALTALQLIDDTVFTDDTSTHTPATTKVVGIGMVADDTSTDSVNEGDIGMPRMTLDRKVVVHPQPNATAGWTTKNCTSSDGSTALTNSAQAIKASAGSLGGWFIYNPNSVAAYVQLYNTAAASVTVGTTNPLFMITIPPGSAANAEFSMGIAFSNAGWSAAATSTAGGNGALTTALDAVFFYV